MERLSSILPERAASFISRTNPYFNMAMDAIKAHPWVALGGAAGTAMLLGYWRKPKNLPPGPFNYPIIGALSCFGGDIAKKMVAWRKLYGEIVCFYRFGSPMIILNSGRMIREGFVKQSEDLAHRVKEGNMADGLCITDEIFSAHYNEDWKKNKKFVLSTLKSCGFGTAKSEAMLHSQIQLFEEVLSKSNGAPIDISNELKIFTSGVMASIIMGVETSWKNPQSIDLLHKTVQWNNAMFEYINVVHPFGETAFPALAKLLSISARRHLRAVNLEMMNYLKSKVIEHTVGINEREPNDVIDIYLKERGTDAETIDQISRTTLLFLLDSIDTAGVVDLWSVFFLVLHPQVQKSLQQEVEEIVGSNRHPTLADRVNMPYAQAIVHETLRHMLLVDMSLGRRIQKNIALAGYNIPKGAVVFANWYAASYEQETFPEPESFNPSRFIDGDGKFDTTLAAKIVTFGAGTRKCIGETYFKAHLFLMLTHLVQRFHITFDPTSPAPTMDDTKPSITTQLSFKCCYNPR